MKNKQMKKIASILMVFVTALGFSQVTKNLGEFDSVSVFDKISVELIDSNENRIEITGSRANDVEIVNKNGTLKIRMAVKNILDGEDVSVKLYFKDINEISANEGSYVICDTPIKQTAIKVDTKEGAEVRLNLDVKKVNLRAVTGGILKIKGKATNSDVSLGTGGVLQAEDLQTVQTSIKITTGGEADIRASELVDAKVRAGGNITIYGSPQQINKSTTLGGSINESKR
ncbi:head GIN domain-containing protein [Flavobacterium antarcticum]|uniref:head GIN domain-containing protein n=2 Tax=Flavobacterium antarcticum TaxID=271155 RepID=UPI0003B43FE9|nr:head GIN domain-containing protein [Flavobacterium antarcticum]